MQSDPDPIIPPPEVTIPVTDGAVSPAQTGGGLPSRKTKDLTGKVFGRLTVLRPLKRYKKGRTYWECQCACGAITAVIGYSLNNGGTSSCGCAKNELIGAAQRTNLVGRQFGRLTVVRSAGTNKQSKQLWHCRCSCGKLVVIAGNNLASGNSKSCGCFRSEFVSKTKRLDLIGKKFGRLIVLAQAGVDWRRQQRWMCQCSCGTVKIVSGNGLISGHTRSCGCYNREQTHKANFNPLLTEEDRTRKRLDRYGQDRMKVLVQHIFSRDNHVCLACGERGGRLAAHHIFPWASHKNLRYSSSNLITLCQCCHKQFHYIYGDDCDLDDLEEYLKP